MDVFPKFIIEKNIDSGETYLIIGKATYHRQLACSEENVVSGGWYTYDNKDKSFTFHGESDQFGRAEVEHILDCVRNDRVSTKHQRRDLSKKTGHKFYHRDQAGQKIELI